MCSSKLVDEASKDGKVRPHCRVCQWTYYLSNLMGVHVVIDTPEGVVFLTQQDEPSGNPASLPGGSVELGETPEEAAVRQAREQTGLVVQITQDLGRQFDKDFPLGPLLHFAFEARAIGGNLRAIPGTRVAVFPEDQFPEVTASRKGSQRALAAYKEAKRWSKSWVPGEAGSKE
jgi:8-oxo-dGTP diphosphatase